MKNSIILCFVISMLVTCFAMGQEPYPCEPVQQTYEAAEPAPCEPVAATPCEPVSIAPCEPVEACAPVAAAFPYETVSYTTVSIKRVRARRECCIKKFLQRRRARQQMRQQSRYVAPPTC